MRSLAFMSSFISWILSILHLSRSLVIGLKIHMVNKAGINFNVGPENSVEHAEQVINSNYYGTKQVVEAMIPLMKPSTSGARIVNVSSRLGRWNGRRNVIRMMFSALTPTPGPDPPL